MQEIQQRLAGSEVRLLTLTGPPGVGKTRLALEAAAHLPEAFDNGIIFADLTPIRDPALVASTIAQSLGVVEWPQRPVLAALADFLQEQHLLLVLDNYEQVLDAADVVDHLVAMCPGIKILVTSRPCRVFIVATVSPRGESTHISESACGISPNLVVSLRGETCDPSESQ